MATKKNGAIAMHEELEALNREREETAAEQRDRALALKKDVNEKYVAAVAERESIKQAGIANGEVVNVYDPALLSAETKDILEHMGTPVPPVDEVFPNGVTIPNRQKA